MGTPPSYYKIVAYAVSDNGEGKVIKIKETDWDDEDWFDLPPLKCGWIYQICREAVYLDD